MVGFFVLASLFIFANVVWFLLVLNNNYSDIIRPSFINSSYDPKRGKEEIESYLLKSFQKHLTKYLNLTSERNIVNNYTSDIFSELSELRFSNFSKYSLFLNSDKKEIHILKITNEKESQNRYENKFGEISLYSIPSHNFIDYKKNDNNKSFIKQCWSTKFYGRIIGAVSSSDKLNLAIFYRVISGHNINYRIRFFHNLTCENKEIGKKDIDNIFLDILNEVKVEKENKSDINYLLKEQNLIISSKQTYSCEKKIIFPNYFDDNTFDDFSLRGNTPINAMTIKKDILIYSRDFDYRQLYALKRMKTDDETMWKISYLGPQINKKINPFFHTNSLKLLHDESNDYKILQIYLSVNTSRITITSNVIKANHTDYNESNFKDENHTIITFSQYLLDDKIITNFEDFSTEAAIKNMKRYMRPTVFSNNNNVNLIFEFFETSVFSLDWNESVKKHSLYEVISGNLVHKISKISADHNNQNIVINCENTKDLIFIFRNKDEFISKNIVYEYMYHLSLKKLPKSYRQKQILSFSVEQVNNKVILFLLLEDGILVSTDLTNVKKSWIPQNALIWMIFNEINTSVILIIVINLFTLVVYSRYFRRNNTIQNVNNNMMRRNQDINQVLRDVLRVNNVEQENLNQVGNENINNNINPNANQNQPPNDNLNNPDENNIMNNNIQNARDLVIQNNTENNYNQANQINEVTSNNFTHINNDLPINRENSLQIEEEKSSEDPSIQNIIENNRFLREIQSNRIENDFDKEINLSQPLKDISETQNKEESSG